VDPDELFCNVSVLLHALSCRLNPNLLGDGPQNEFAEFKVLGLAVSTGAAGIGLPKDKSFFNLFRFAEDARVLSFKEEA
jgi:hypothetical protein